MQIIKTPLFSMNGVIIVHKSDRNVCPICNSRHIAIHADNNGVRIYCSKCFWEEYYKRILKNGEIK